MNTKPPIRFPDNFAYIRRAMESFTITVKESGVYAFSWIRLPMQNLLNNRATAPAPALLEHRPAEVPQFKKKRTRFRKTYHDRYKQGVTNAVITYAALCGDIVILDLEGVPPHDLNIGQRILRPT